MDKVTIIKDLLIDERGEHEIVISHVIDKSANIPQFTTLLLTDIKLKLPWTRTVPGLIKKTAPRFIKASRIAYRKLL
jgi:hypothetical protein